MNSEIELRARVSWNLFDFFWGGGVDECGLWLSCAQQKMIPVVGAHVQALNGVVLKRAPYRFAAWGRG
jgi:hypothetical protein